MGEVSLNSFNKGMTQDLGKTLPQDGSYLEGRNIRIIANESSEESGILVNVEGNSFSFKLEYNCATCESLWEATGSLQMYSTNYVVPVHSFVKIGGQIYITDPEAEEWGGITIPANEELLEDIIKEERDLIPCTPALMQELIDMENWVPFYSSDTFLSLPEFIDYDTIEEWWEEYPDWETYFLPFADLNYDGVTIPPLQASFCSADPIGWATIRDSIYIFAANNEKENPGKIFPDAPGVSIKTSGYIFEVDFNLRTNQASTPFLIYEHEELNFSKMYPIEAIGRYENEQIKRLYWTDNFNTVRTINIADPNASDLIPDDLQLNPSIEFGAPVVKNILNGGNLPAGMYQYAYRLKTSGGAETKFSIFTNFLHIVEAAEGADYWNYTEDPEDISEYNGSVPGTICSKSVSL